jgi:RNA polymerase sigma factor (sigma-70 family)
VAEAGDRKRSSPEIEDWENDLIAWAARQAKPRDQEELRDELARHLLLYKIEPKIGVRNWRAYARTFLRNRALNWLRHRRQRETASLDESIDVGGEGVFTLADTVAVEHPDHEQRIGLAMAIGQLSPKLQAVWRAYIDAEGNQAEMARRPGVHRNTVSLWVCKIRRVLTAHGLGPNSAAGHTSRRPMRRKQSNTVTKSRTFVLISPGLLQTLAQIRLSGTQWRILLWMLSETARQSRKAILFSWTRIAKGLSVDRSVASRAGRDLLRSRLLHLEGGRIGITPPPKRGRADNPRR